MRRVRLPLAALCLFACTLAHANIDIDVRGVNDQLRKNVLAYLSMSRYKDRDVDAATFERLHARVEREVKAALRPFGYYAPQVKTDVSRDHADWNAVIHIDPGQPVIMKTVDIRVVGPGASFRRFQRILRHTGLHPGQRLRDAAYDQVKDELERTAATYGYLDARMTRSELRVDPAHHTASAFLQLDTGVRYRFGVTTIKQNVIDPSLVRRYMRYRKGQHFNMTALLRTQFALDDSEYFSTVEVLPGTPDRVHHTVPISITAQPSRRDRYSFGVGYGTDTGVRGTVIWDRRRVNTAGHRISVQIQTASQTQGLQSRYMIPIGDPAVDQFSLTGTVNQSDIDDLHTENIELGPNVTLVRDRWQEVLSITAARSLTDYGNTHRWDKLIVPSITIASVPRGYLGETLFRRGFYAELRGSSHLFGSSQDFLQLHIQAERSFRITRKWHLLLRGEIGASLVSRLSDLPGTYRFFAGGDRSVRGFGFNELSPVQKLKGPDGRPVLDPETGKPILLKVGGRDLLTGSIEIDRDLPHHFGVAAFFDFGNAFDTFGKSPDPDNPHFLQYSVGVGFRWRLPVLTLGIDIAQPLSEPGASPRLDINFSPKL